VSTIYEIPSGTVNGTNPTFAAVAPITSEQLFVDRVLQVPGTDYTVVGNTITFLAGAIPQAGALIRLYYPGAGYAPPSGGVGYTTLLNVRTAAQQRADMVNSQYLTNAEWNANIQASQQELYGLLVQKFGDDYFVAGTPDNWYQFSTNGTSNSYALPDGTNAYLLKDGVTIAPAFFKLLGVDLQVQGATNGWLTLKRFPFTERNRFTFPNVQLGYGRRDMLMYRPIGNMLWLTPIPSGGQTIRIFYVPRLSVPTQDTDVIDGVNGWEEYLVIDAAIKALQKEESDVSVLAAQKAAIIARLEAEAENRDAGSPERVADVRGRRGSYGAPAGDDDDGNWS
jgi:hypothetical protein